MSMGRFLLALAALLCLGLALYLWRRGEARRRKAGLPPGRLIYADTGVWRRCERPLFSRRHLLTGRPDYLVHEGGRLIPVEVKSAPSPPHPYRSHVMQLAAYCLLVEDVYGRAPPYGILKYRDKSWVVDYTPSLRAELLHLLASMRKDLSASDVPPNHDSARRCLACGFRSRCRRRLA